MEVRRVPGGAGRATVAASGQIDLATAPQLAKALAQARSEGTSEIVVDLSAVDFMDSAGVRVLVQAARESTEAGVQLFLQGAQGWVARVLEITGVAGFLPPPPDPTPDDRR
jgi:anti-sigma B factor antagonist